MPCPPLLAAPSPPQFPPLRSQHEEMMEEEPNWFTKWEEELPTPEELTPLSQTLITPDLAVAFDIPGYNSSSIKNSVVPTFPLAHHQSPSPSLQGPPSQQQQQQPLEYESPEVAGGGGGDDQARTLKRPRLVWTPQLHKRFVDAVTHLGIKSAVPKTIMQLMSVDGLTRENVASHLQKYRLYLKRVQGLSSASSSVGGGDPATDHLFATGPIPHHFLARAAADQFAPFMPVPAAQQQQHYYQQRQIGNFGSPPLPVFDHGFLPRHQQGGLHRIVSSVGPGMIGGRHPSTSFAEEFDPGMSAERKVLTLFPTNEN